MNDLDLLLDLGTDLDPADDTVPAELLTDVRTRIRDEQTRRRPLVRPLGIAASVAAFALVAATIATLARPGDDGIPFNGPNVSATADGTVNPRLDAGDFLLAAAVTVRAQPSTVPAPTGYVYTRSDQVGLELSSANDRLKHNRPFTHVRESWLSVDGNHDSWLTAGQSTELGRVDGCPVTTRTSTTDCLHQPAWVADAPTTKAAMLTYLCRTTDGPGCGPQGSAEWTSDVFQHGSDLLIERIAPPKVRAAVFEALSALPGMEVVTDATTVSGRKGTAVALDDAESNRRSEIVFDPRTFEVIGERQALIQAENGAGAGTVVWSNAVLEKAVVAKPGLRPDGTRRKLPCGHWICLP